MKQIEIRLAVVLYGGVSLAVYIHGVTRELLNLIRASRQFHAERHAANGAAASDRPAPTAATDSTAVYQDLLLALAPDVDLRIVIDLVSGASAGGINGVMLARALAHDLPLESHRDLWLSNADVTQLSAPASLLSRALKAPLAPLMDQLLIRRFGPLVADAETRAKIRRFVQARWFTPPFSGDRFTGWLLDACDAMEEAVRPNGTLLPPGHRLDLFVTVTDYRGHRQRIELHDPAVVEETEHRRILSFSCHRNLSGEITSEFGPDHVPGLVFASRATSSFPGAFRPATIAEMDDVLDQRDRYWPTRQEFMTAKLGITGDLAQAAQNRYYIDGSVVMNKPFSPVIRALGDRPASREIVRRIIYVDPNPTPDVQQRTGRGAPGFFRTILASLAVIPRNEPIADDLGAIESWNKHARRLAEILDAADPEVERLVDDIIDLDPDNPPTIADVTRYRKMANEAAHRGAGYAYLSYQKLKIRSVIDQLAALLARLAGSEPDGTVCAKIGTALDRWLAAGTPPDPGAQVEDAEIDNVVRRRIRFLRGFDVAFRLRRTRFVIRRLNELYRDHEGALSALESGRVDALKAALYEAIEETAQVGHIERHGSATAAAAKRIVEAAMADSDIETPDLRVIERALGLVDIDTRLDEIISVVGFAFLPPPARRTVAIAYIGFAFFDLITFPILQWTEMDEINEVLVDRISPDDATGLQSGGITLRGTSLMSFGAFFNRAWREHDFLWGRLNAAERCIDVILSAIGPHLSTRIDPHQIRGRLFLAILDAEEPHLQADPALIPRLRQEITARYGFA
ncbi:patatin-related protein [Dongia mobilis]|uniref:Patatin-related protein n=1 Tax=Dongia mobilis TaxID=578943 RepID=A0A4R6WL14_9PROT|nr:patatin-like protein [Dongia mobilis]TDQ81392.1 patatin-related protein [Dongia mobilis]